VIRYRAAAGDDATVAGVDVRFANDTEWAGRLAAALEEEPTLAVTDAHDIRHRTLACDGPLPLARVEALGTRVFGGVLRAVDARPTWRPDHDGILQLAFLTLVAESLARRGEVPA